MPADALPVPHGTHLTAMPMGLLPGGGTGFTLTFGAYDDPAFVGMRGILKLSAPLVHIATGVVLRQSWMVTIAGDGTASLTDLPYNDDPAFAPTGSTYSLEWQVLSYRPTPGNKLFSVARTDGATIDYDLLSASATTGVLAPGGVTPSNLDGLVAALLANPASASRAAALGLPTYPNGA